MTNTDSPFHGETVTLALSHFNTVVKALQTARESIEDIRRHGCNLTQVRNLHNVDLPLIERALRAIQESADIRGRSVSAPNSPAPINTFAIKVGAYDLFVGYRPETGRTFFKTTTRPNGREVEIELTLADIQRVRGFLNQVGISAAADYDTLVAGNIAERLTLSSDPGRCDVTLSITGAGIYGPVLRLNLAQAETLADYLLWAEGAILLREEVI